MSGATMIGVLWLVAAGCTATPPPADAGRDDARLIRRDDAGPRIDGARVRVEAAWWRAPRELRVVTSVDNPSDTALPLGPGGFVVRDEEGRAIPGRAEGPCPEVLDPGANGRCTLGFALDGWPRALEHDAGEAPILGCGDAHPFGLCPPESQCVDGACEARCDEAHQDGACANPDEVCDGGECVSPCSDGPEGGCEDGACVEGRCEPLCHGLAIRDSGCWACLWRTIDGEHCVVEDRCRDCADCPGTREPGGVARTTCDCLAGDRCGGCEDPSRAYWGCLVEACPACLE